jgi:hypothetical protein
MELALKGDYPSFFVKFIQFWPDVTPSKFSTGRKSDATIWRLLAEQGIEWVYKAWV